MSRRYYLFKKLFLAKDETYIFMFGSSKRHLDMIETTSALEIFLSDMMLERLRIDKSSGWPNLFFHCKKSRSTVFLRRLVFKILNQLRNICRDWTNQVPLLFLSIHFFFENFWGAKFLSRNLTALFSLWSNINLLNHFHLGNIFLSSKSRWKQFVFKRNLCTIICKKIFSFRIERVWHSKQPFVFSRNHALVRPIHFLRLCFTSNWSTLRTDCSALCPGWQVWIYSFVVF